MMKKFIVCLLIFTMIFSINVIPSMAESKDDITVIVKDTTGTYTDEDGDTYDTYNVYIKAPAGTTISSAELQFTGKGLEGALFEDGWKVGPCYYEPELETRFHITCTTTTPFTSSGSEFYVGRVLYRQKYVKGLIVKYTKLCDAEGNLIGHYVKNEVDDTYVSHTGKCTLNYIVKEGKGYIACDVPSGASVMDGTTLSMTAVPAPGYILNYWQDSEGKKYSNIFNAAQVRITEDITMEAHFEKMNNASLPTLKKGNSNATNNPFLDVKKGDWYEEAVVWAYNNKLLAGISGNKFDPNGKVTRGMLATVMHRFMTEYYVDPNMFSGTISDARNRNGKFYTVELDIKDANKADWFYSGTKFCVETGIMSGTSKMQFSYNDKKEVVTGHFYFTPYKNATREQVVATIAGYTSIFGLGGGVAGDNYWEGTGISDGDQVSEYANWRVRNLLFYGIVKGTPGADGKLYFNPKGEITRAEFAQILMNTAKILNEY